MRESALCMALALGAAICPAAEDYRPKVCETALPYRGGPLHAAVVPDVFSKLPPVSNRALDPALAARLDAAIDWILNNTTAPGVTAAVAVGDQGSWAVSRGLAIAEPPMPLPERPYFHWASAGKLFTSSVVMQLADQGKLGYDDPLAKWFPEFPNAKVITIDHLLTHTGGIFSFNADLQFRKQLGYKPPQRLIEIAARHGCAFCPGERWSYSNTGYVLLGKIIETIEERPLHDVIRGRIIEPLGLTHTIALIPGNPPAELAIGHVGKIPDHDFEPTTPFGAGNVGASAEDMIRFWHAMLSGKIIRPRTVARAFDRLYPMFEPGLFYGRGVMLLEFNDNQGRKVTWLGHSGGTPGIKSVVAYDVEAGAYVAVALNGNVSAEATANKLLGEIKAHQAARR